MSSNWEKKHQKFFREYRDRFQDIYSKMPWGGSTSNNIHYRLKEFFDFDTKAEVEAIEKYRQIITTCRLRESSCACITISDHENGRLSVQTTH